MTAHSTISSLPSPNVFHTAFSSSLLPVIVTRVPPPVTGFPSGVTDFEMCPNCIRFGGMRSDNIPCAMSVWIEGETRIWKDTHVLRRHNTTSSRRDFADSFWIFGRGAVLL